MKKKRSVESRDRESVRPRPARGPSATVAWALQQQGLAASFSQRQEEHRG
jgi:hypothetical protein